MKASILAILLLNSLPTYAHHNMSKQYKEETYVSHKGYAYEEKCYRYEYREDYIPGNSISPGYVRSYKERVPLTCKVHNSSLIHDKFITTPKAEYINYLSQKKCNSNTTLGGLIGGGIAASLSKKDAYGWTIPLGTLLGASLSNAECNK